MRSLRKILYESGYFMKMGGNPLPGDVLLHDGEKVEYLGIELATEMMVGLTEDGSLVYLDPEKSEYA
ncbi:hypothetical protein [Psychromarinibacter sp. S121]|uniref:hypothetical protein n=1 Tax=Psychromarinibacter sp. S121 TaxID=3415127 RepID=UPI003C7CDBC9